MKNFYKFNNDPVFIISATDLTVIEKNIKGEEFTAKCKKKQSYGKLENLLGLQGIKEIKDFINQKGKGKALKNIIFFPHEECRTVRDASIYSEIYEGKNVVLLQISGKEDISPLDAAETFFELSLDYSVLLSFDGTILKANDMFLKKFGYGNIEGGNYSEFVRQGLENEVQAEVQKLIEGKELLNFEIRLPDKNGDPRWIQWNASSIPELGIIFAFGRDITERKEAERLLIATEQKYDILTQKFPIVSFVVDRKGNYQMIEGKAGQMLGFPGGKTGELTVENFPLKLKYLTSGEILGPEETMKRAASGEEMSGISAIGDWYFDTRIVPLYKDNEFSGIAGFAIDVTDRMKAIEALSESEKRFRLAVDAFPYAFMIYDKERRYVFLNDYIKKVTGIAEENIIGKRDEELYESMYTDRWVPELKEAITKKETKSKYVELPIGNENRYFRASFIPVTGENGEIDQVLGVWYDITEQEKSKRAAKASEKDYREIFEHAHDAIIIFEPEKEIVLNVNQRACAIYGFEREEFIGMSIESISVNPAKGKTLIEETLTKKAFVSFETQQYSKSGEKIYFDVNASLIKYKGRPAIQSINRDITRRKLIELEREELQHERNILLEKLQTHIRKMPVGYILYNKDLRITQVNPKAEEIFGYSADEFIGKTPFDIVPDEIKIDMERIAEKIRIEELPVKSTNENFTKSGHKIFCEWYNTPIIDEDGEYDGILSMVIDISDRVKAEKKNKKLFDQVTEANKQLGNLSKQLIEVQEKERAAIARELHDEIGQILTAVKISMQSTKKAVNSAIISDMVDEDIKLIESTLNRVRNLSLNLRPSVLDDLGLLPAIRWFADNQTKRSTLAVKLELEELDKRLRPELEITMFRIMQEAVTNSIKHSSSNSIKILLKPIGEKVILKVEDDGIGFNPEESIEKARRGKSIGLLGMKERAELVGGTLSIRSIPGKGTTIAAEFPVEEKKNE